MGDRASTRAIFMPKKPLSRNRHYAIDRHWNIAKHCYHANLYLNDESPIGDNCAFVDNCIFWEGNSYETKDRLKDEISFPLLLLAITRDNRRFSFY